MPSNERHGRKHKNICVDLARFRCGSIGHRDGRCDGMMDSRFLRRFTPAASSSLQNSCASALESTVYLDISSIGRCVRVHPKQGAMLQGLPQRPHAAPSAALAGLRPGIVLSTPSMRRYPLSMCRHQVYRAAPAFCCMCGAGMQCPSVCTQNTYFARIRSACIANVYLHLIDAKRLAWTSRHA